VESVVSSFVFQVSILICCRQVDMAQFKAAREGDLQGLSDVLTVHNISDVDRDGNRRTVLHCVAFGGHVDCVNLCLAMHANVNERDNFGWTPLYYSSTSGAFPVVRILLDAGANVDEKSKLGWTPLYGAIRNGHVDVAKLLIDRGANLSTVDNFENSLVIPDWVTTLMESRSNCRIAVIVVIGVHKYHCTTVTGNNDINVLRLIGKHFWSMRMGDVSSAPIKD
jgi:hypothetical protein